MPTLSATVAWPPLIGSAMPATLVAHLAQWVGGLPTDRPVSVVGNTRRAGPGWDGRRQPLVGLVDPAGRVVLSVAPRYAGVAARRLDERAPTVAAWQHLPALLGRPGHAVEQFAFRWCVDPADLPEVGVWVEADSPRLPEWLHPFGGRALVAFDERGRYLAGVGIKRHDGHGHEIAVGTQPLARGRGLARRLVAQAARHILDAGRAVTYLHAPDNEASARVAAAAGFVDLGWSALMLSDRPGHGRTPAGLCARRSGL
jgi:GNAT superfamily N-acetyltransferase